MADPVGGHGSAGPPSGGGAGWTRLMCCRRAGICSDWRRAESGRVLGSPRGPASSAVGEGTPALRAEGRPPPESPTVPTIPLLSALPRAERTACSLAKRLLPRALPRALRGGGVLRVGSCCHWGTGGRGPSRRGGTGDPVVGLFVDARRRLLDDSDRCGVAPRCV